MGIFGDYILKQPILLDLYVGVGLVSLANKKNLSTIILNQISSYGIIDRY